MREIVVVSGGFDPIHSGHIKLIKEAAKYGEVVVLLNSDLWLQKKKGKEFLPYIERAIIMNELKNVIDVIEFDDGDKTCIDGLKKVKKKYMNRQTIINKLIEKFKMVIILSPRKTNHLVLTQDL